MRLIDADALLEVVEKYQSKLKEFNPAHDYLDDVTDLITNAPTAQRDVWVSVEDKLPNKGEDVLAYAGWPITAIWDGENTFYTEDGTNPIYHVSHWQYLPAAPTDKE